MIWQLTGQTIHRNHCIRGFVFLHLEPESFYPLRRNIEPFGIYFNRLVQVAILVALNCGLPVAIHFNTVQQGHSGKSIGIMFRMVRIYLIMMLNCRFKSSHAFLVFRGIVFDFPQLGRIFIEIFLLRCFQLGLVVGLQL